MLRIDYLINQLSDAKFITTLDLTYEYWSRHLTAFTTLFGLFQF